MKNYNVNMATARVIAGAGVFALTLIVLAIMVFYPELAKDDLFKMIAQAIVIQGLIGLVMAFLFTGKNDQSDQATGKADDPVHVDPDGDMK